MSVAECKMQNYKIDDHFESVTEFTDLEEADPEVGSSELDWWLSQYPTLEEAEAQILKLHNRLRELDRNDFDGSLDYLSECATFDYDIMMLEMTIDALYEDWSPNGSKHEDFKIGTIFRSGSGRFLCTDVGQRTVVAIRYTPRTPENMKGPPYFLVESVFDEDDIKGVDILNP